MNADFALCSCFSFIARLHPRPICVRNLLSGQWPQRPQPSVHFLLLNLFVVVGNVLFLQRAMAQKCLSTPFSCSISCYWSDYICSMVVQASPTKKLKKVFPGSPEYAALRPVSMSWAISFFLMAKFGHNIQLQCQKCSKIYWPQVELWDVSISCQCWYGHL